MNNSILLTKTKYILKYDGKGLAMFSLFMSSILCFMFYMMVNPENPVIFTGTFMTLCSAGMFGLTFLSTIFGGENYPPDVKINDTVFYKNGYVFKESVNTAKNSFTVKNISEEHAVILLQNQESKELIEISFEKFNKKYGPINDLK